MTDRAQPPNTAIPNTPFTDLIGRLSVLLDQETEMLKAGNLTDIIPYIQKKVMIALQLSSFVSLVGPEMAGPVLRELAALRGKLTRNLATIQLNIRALHELNEILAERHRDADSDGTYSIYQRQVR